MDGEQPPKAKLHHLNFGDFAIQKATDLMEIRKEVMAAREQLPPNVMPIYRTNEVPPDQAA